MRTVTEPRLTHVTSADGTQIAVFVSGTGRPLVVVPGTTSDHTTWRFVLPLLERHVAVHAVDRRGRGRSGDHPDYTLEKEYVDVAAVVDAAASAFGGPVDLLGHSYGGNVAFGAATRTTNLRRLVLYEGWPVPDIADRTTPPELLARIDALLEEDRPEQALELFYRGVVKMTTEEVDALKAAPTWPARVAAAHTVPREVRAFGEQAFDPELARRVTVPVLLLVGGATPADIQADPDVVAAALPDARIHVLDGQAHLAHLTAPEEFAAQVLAFLSPAQ
jgi:pimeloyl-ACP methyl ester carboxylesterase